MTTRHRLEVGGGLVLARELHRVFGVSRQRAAQLAARTDFPRPATRTVEGEPIWRVHEVRAWNDARLGRVS